MLLYCQPLKSAFEIRPIYRLQQKEQEVENVFALIKVDMRDERKSTNDDPVDLTN
ncbi:protein of unknown function [Xenorhabdus doucetiae]|uniref:Uncharacterized protein n=1 Tax=Xenorhabdus doucetiae TaxID=351671 RepID=A0A068QMB3_9GAMM|nr:protein of unknown function [Xenorhabdus doucetiae]